MSIIWENGLLIHSSNRCTCARWASKPSSLSYILLDEVACQDPLSLKIP